MLSRFVCALIFASLLPIWAASAATPVVREKEVIRLINDFRKLHKLRPLRAHERLKESTRLKVTEMARLRYFAHTSPQGEEFYENVKRARYTYRAVGEVLAKGCRTERDVLRVWASSPPHRQALLDPRFEHVNCSSAMDSRTSYVVCHLGATMKR